MSKKTECETCGFVAKKTLLACPVCGGPMRKKKAGPLRITLAVILLIIGGIVLVSGIVGIILGAADAADDPNAIIHDTSADVINSEGTISLAEFNAIQIGMTYTQVCQIIGGEGTLFSEVNIGMGAEYATKIYEWSGNGSVGANANITFQGGKVVAKAQFGLQ